MGRVWYVLLCASRGPKELLAQQLQSGEQILIIFPKHARYFLVLP